MEIGIALVAMLVALVLGLVVGWLAWGRAAASGRMAESALAGANARAEQAELLRRTLDAVTRERDAALQDRAGLQATAARVAPLEAELAEARSRNEALFAEQAGALRAESERERAHQQQVTQLKEIETRLDARFGELAGKALDDAQQRLLKRADERFKESELLSGERLGALLSPVNERLLRYEEGVAKFEAERRDAFGTLHGLIQSMRDGQERVSGEAAKLVNALRNAPKARGRWGEQQLRNVLENCGLSEHADFQTEVSVEGEDGRLRPDAIVRIPGGRTLVIDAKVSLNAYQDAFGAVDEAERTLHLAAHHNAMRAHVTTLGSKAYQTRFADTADYVVMFVPGEHFVSAALESDPTLWDFAFDRRVLLATPTNLIAIARTVAAVWRQERLASDARRIGELGKEMHDRLATAADHLRIVGGGLTTAVERYNRFVSSFERNVMSTGRKFQELNIEPPSKAMPEISPIEALPRYGDAGASTIDADAPALPGLQASVA